MRDTDPTLSARTVAGIMAWIERWPSPADLFGRFARWVPAAVFLTGLALVLVLLFGAPFGAEAGRWLVGAAAVPVWILRVATLERARIRAPRYGAAVSTAMWWLAGVGVVGGLWAPSGAAGLASASVVAVLFLFLAHGRYRLAEDRG